ncbi:MAG: hypothetical protein N4A43_03585 [Alphaproteobacteria bacterium]|jgi:hypothetical protein|nr:hypothetical protein [Alphaproteobacteria bacterium]
MGLTSKLKNKAISLSIILMTGASTGCINNKNVKHIIETPIHLVKGAFATDPEVWDKNFHSDKDKVSKIVKNQQSKNKVVEIEIHDPNVIIPDSMLPDKYIIKNNKQHSRKKYSKPEF